MQMFYLPVGTVLQQRYEILSLIGHGGFGMTYLCNCLWSQQRVVVKELFWNGYMTRAEDKLQVKVADPELEASFQRMQERFLLEARTLLRFSEERSIVRVLDYFQANGTAYLVTEWIDGMTLEQYVQQHGPTPAEKLFRKILPLLDGLEKIHHAGFLHRDISADNLMLSRDGSLKLVDFGAARDFSNMDPATVSRYVKTGYSPQEQYTNPGAVCAASDLYALGAVLYRCITGKMPPSSLSRIQKDDIPWPSQLGISMEPSLEAVLQKMMALEPRDRYASAQEVKKAVEVSLPRTDRPRTRKRLWAAAAVLFFAGILAVALWPGKKADPFAGRQTEQFYLEYPASSTDQQRQELYNAAETAVTAFADGVYTMEQLKQGILVTVPLDCFQGQDIRSQLEFEIVYRLPMDVSWRYQMQVTWQEPVGENQVRREELVGELVLLETSSIGNYMEGKTTSERNMQQTLLCARLDALETPYALGVLQGTDGLPVIAISPAHLSRSALLILGAGYSAFSVHGLWQDASVSPGLLDREPVTILQGADSRLGVGIALDTTAVRDTVNARGEPYLYLSFQRDGFDAFHMPEQIALAACPLDQAGDALEFWDFLLAGNETLGADMEWLPQYWAACLNGEKLVTNFWIESTLILDEAGQPQWEETPEEHFGIQEMPTAPVEALDQLTDRLRADGLDVTQHPGVLRISLHLPASVAMLTAGLEEAARLTSAYDMDTVPGRIQILLWDTVYGVPDQELATNFTNQCAFVVLDDRMDGPGKQATATAVGALLQEELPALNQAWADCAFAGNIQKGQLGYAFETTTLACGVYAGTQNTLSGKAQ